MFGILLVFSEYYLLLKTCNTEILIIPSVPHWTLLVKMKVRRFRVFNQVELQDNSVLLRSWWQW